MQDNRFLTGYTSSTDFPLQHPLQGKPGGEIDAFIADPSMKLIQGIWYHLFLSR